MKLYLFLIIEYCLFCMIINCYSKAGKAIRPDVSISCKDENWWYRDRKFYFQIKNDSGIRTIIAFDTANIKEGDNAEFVRYYFYKDIHIGCLVSYTITTDTIFDGQVTTDFILKINKFYPDPALKLSL